MSRSPDRPPAAGGEDPRLALALILAGEAGRLAIAGQPAVVRFDGTNNYALGIPCFAISVGLLRRGEPYAGVVHEPNT